MLIALPAHAATPQEPGTNERAILAPIAEALDAVARDAGVPAFGLVLLDGDGGALVHTTGPNVDADTPFRWGSITKTFTALTALAVAAHHGIDTKVPVSPTLTRPTVYQNRWHASDPLRLIHLLESSAGFTDLTNAEFSNTEPVPLQRAFQQPSRSRDAQWPPGLQHSYSNVAPGLTELWIERVTRRPFASAMRTHVLTPLGMARASLEPVAGLPGGFKADAVTPIPYWHMYFPAFGALNASTAEMRRFLQALADGGTLDGRAAISATTIDHLRYPRSTVAARHGLQVGYASGMYGWIRRGHLWRGHGGDADGYQSRYGLLHGTRRGYLLVINVDRPRLVRRLARMAELRLSHGVARPPEPPESVTPVPGSAAGTYYPSAARFGLSRWRAGNAEPAFLSVQNHRVIVRHGERRTELLHTHTGKPDPSSQAYSLRRAGDPFVTAVLVREGQSWMLHGEPGNYVQLIDGCSPLLDLCIAQ